MNLLRRALAPFGEFPDLAGHDRETFSRIARARGLDRRVQSQ